MSKKSVDSLIKAEVQMPHRSTKKSKTPHDYTGRSMPNKIQWRMDVFSFKCQSQELLVVANILDYCDLTVLSYVATKGYETE